jgi:FtsP/CotA-like multicopper oxidase with cupredoxin domain
VLSRGNAVRDTVYTARQRRQAVTEYMTAGTTMAMQWIPTRPGNWLFHCHLIYHIDAALRLTELPDSAHHGNHAIEAMAGLITGIEVTPKKGGSFATDPVARRNIRVFANERPNVFGNRPGYSFVMQNGLTPPAVDSVQFPSSTLLLRKGEPTAITVINRTHNAVSIHWHGIELESYYDGVAGWSGWKDRVQPMITPGDSFVVRMTPDRSGTFIYHTHSDESNQLNSGLYGPLLVLDEDAVPDPNERVLLMGEGGPQANALPFVNGTATPAPIDMRVGATHRIRLINISAASRKRVRLVADTTLQAWRAAAKDGADLSPEQAVMRPAEVFLGPGETADFDVTRSRSEVLTIEIITPVRNSPPIVTRIPVVVR